MNNIEIFNEDIKIDLKKFVDSRALICANSGGGKSYAVRKILEESNKKVLSIVLDVEGEFRTLREKFDFLLIGEEGDVPLNMSSAKLLPEKIISLNIPTIIDISDLKRSERIKYVKDFIEALMQLPRNGGYWKPCLVIIDEAHLLAGQQEKQDSCSAVIDLMTRGRKRGYCGILCTQRISKLHKDAVAECNNIMIGRTGLDIDMKRASEILGFTSKKDMLSLRDLDAGEFYVFGTAISRAVIKSKISKVKTTHPEVGMDLRKEIIQPTENIKKILTKLSELPKEAERKRKELIDYKKEIAELKINLRKAESQKQKMVIDERLLEKERVNGYKQCKNEMMKEVSFYKKENENLITLMNKIGSLLKIKPLPSKEFEYHNRVLPKLNNSPIRTETIVSDNAIELDYRPNLCVRKIYSFLFSNPDRVFSKKQVAFMTGYRISGSFNNALYWLNTRGLIKLDSSEVSIGELNPELATEEKEEFRKELFINKLNKCERAIFEILWENNQQSYSKMELTELTGYQYSGSFNNAVYHLNSLNFIEKSGNSIKLNPEILELI